MQNLICLALALLDLLLDQEDGGNMFYLNVDTLKSTGRNIPNCLFAFIYRVK